MLTENEEEGVRWRLEDRREDLLSDPDTRCWGQAEAGAEGAGIGGVSEPLGRRLGRRTQMAVDDRNGKSEMTGSWLQPQASSDAQCYREWKEKHISGCEMMHWV